jgi:hypothetical protein
MEMEFEIRLDDTFSDNTLKVFLLFHEEIIVDRFELAISKQEVELPLDYSTREIFNLNNNSFNEPIYDNYLKFIKELNEELYNKIFKYNEIFKYSKLEDLPELQSGIYVSREDINKYTAKGNEFHILIENETSVKVCYDEITDDIKYYYLHNVGGVWTLFEGIDLDKVGVKPKYLLTPEDFINHCKQVAPKKPKTIYDLEVGDIYHFIDQEGEIHSREITGGFTLEYYKNSLNIGNVYLTKEEAEKHLDRLKAESELKKFIYNKRGVILTDKYITYMKEHYYCYGKSSAEFWSYFNINDGKDIKYGEIQHFLERMCD